MMKKLILCLILVLLSSCGPPPPTTDNTEYHVGENVSQMNDSQNGNAEFGNRVLRDGLATAINDAGYSGT